MQIQQLVEENINFFPVIHQPQHQFLFRVGNERILDLTHPQNCWLCVWILRQTVEVKIDIVGNKANLRVLWILHVV